MPVHVSYHRIGPVRRAKHIEPSKECRAAGRRLIIEEKNRLRMDVLAHEVENVQMAMALGELFGHVKVPIEQDNAFSGGTL